MTIDFRILYLKKRFPLAISRGVRYGSDNLFVSVTKDGITGWGEMAPGKTEGADTAEKGIGYLQNFFTPNITSLPIKKVYYLGKEKGVPACALAALDIALWDWHAKKAGLPLYKYLKLPRPTVPTSLTIGINPPEVVAERVPLLLEGTSVKALKIKLGSPEGIEKDKLMFEQVVKSCANYEVKLRVDANGGWSIPNAKMMMKWLADRGVDYIEQPLLAGTEEQFNEIYTDRPLPIYVDESCRYAEDIPKFADAVDGVNIKLMKCGGISGALEIIEAAKKHKLKTMIGCMGESSISIAAGAALCGALNHVDLDSHLNLEPDPCEGAPMVNGVILPLEKPGHGATIKSQFLTEN